jgi:hypothetical protein
MLGCQNCGRRRALAYYVNPPRRLPTGRLAGMGRVRLRGLRGLGQANDIPAGSQLAYTCTFSASLDPLNSSFYGEANAIASVTQNLQTQWNIAVLNWQDESTGVGTTFTVTLNIQTLADYGSIADIRSVIDGAFYNAAGASVSASQLSLNALASPGSAGPQTNIAPPPKNPNVAFDLPTWFSNNWMYIAGGLVAVVVAREVL